MLGKAGDKSVMDSRRLRIRMCHQFPVDVFADIDLHGSEFEAVEFLL